MEAPACAEALGVARVWVKDESSRLGLPSFKILGASWAIHRALEQRGDRPRLACATDGNHGRAVARVARERGLEATVFVPADMIAARREAIAAEGARVEIVDGSYDEAVERAAQAGALVIQDTGEGEVPRWIVEGYGTIGAEIDVEPDVVAVQIGVGSFAAAMVRRFAGTRIDRRRAGRRRLCARLRRSRRARRGPRAARLGDGGPELRSRLARRLARRSATASRPSPPSPTTARARPCGCWRATASPPERAARPAWPACSPSATSSRSRPETPSWWSTPRATRRFDKFACPIENAAVLLQDPERVRIALSPIRRALLQRLREPSSATRLAAELGVPRQRVNYHLRELERAGLVELVEERQRRGCTERVLAARSFVVDPDVLGEPAVAQDRFAAGHLVNTAAAMARDVTRMQDAAEERGERLLTFTIESEVGLAAPEDLDRFTEALAGLVARFDAPGRRYRVVVGGHPAPAKEET